MLTNIQQLKVKSEIFPRFLLSLNEIERKEFDEKYGNKIEEITHNLDIENKEIEKQLAQKYEIEKKQRQEESEKCQEESKKRREEMENQLKESENRIKELSEAMDKVFDPTIEANKKAKVWLETECNSLEQLYDFFGLSNDDLFDNIKIEATFDKLLIKILDLNDFLYDLQEHLNLLLIHEYKDQKLGKFIFFMCALKTSIRETETDDSLDSIASNIVESNIVESNIVESNIVESDIVESNIVESNIVEV